MPVSRSDSHVLPRPPAVVQTAAFATTERRLLPRLPSGLRLVRFVLLFPLFLVLSPRSAQCEHVFVHTVVFDDSHIGYSVFQSLEAPVHEDTQRGKSGYDLTFVSGPWLPLSLPCSLYCHYECPCRAPLLLSPPAPAPTSSLKTISQLRAQLHTSNQLLWRKKTELRKMLMKSREWHSTDVCESVAILAQPVSLTLHR